MFLGRSTVQWTALFASLGGFAQLVIVQAFPEVDPVAVATTIGALIGVLGALIAFIANTSTTPTADPRLPIGTMVQATDPSGTVVGHVPVPQPAPAPVVASDGEVQP